MTQKASFQIPVQGLPLCTERKGTFIRVHCNEHFTIAICGVLTALTLPHCMQVSTGVTLRENNLKEIEGGRILDSEGILVANKRSLEDPRLMDIVKELIERFEASSSLHHH